jgi:hypothetical protein
MAPLLTGRPDATDLGLLRGEVAISDASGHPRLERLAAKLQGTDLMSLSLRLAESDKGGDGLGLKFEVPDLASLAAALGRKASAAIRIAFDGTFGAADGTAAVRGSLRIGRTDLQGRLRMDAAKGRPEMRGSIRAKDMHLDDLIAAREVAELVSHRKADTLRLRSETMDFVFAPRPKRKNLVGRVGPVDVRGRLSNPEVKLADGAAAAKVLGETIGLPLHLLGSLLGANGRLLLDHKPCFVVPAQQ